MDVTKLLEKAQVAAERGNYDYAIDLYLQLLELQANHAESRRKLREVEVRKFQERGITGSTVGGWIGGFIPMVTALLYVAFRKYEKAIASCEVFLKKDPFNRFVLCTLAEAAVKAEYYETAILVYEEVRSRGGGARRGMALKGHVKVLRRLGELYDKVDKLPVAAERYEEILRLIPKDREAERRIRDIAARRSMAEGGWDKAGKKDGYRDVLKSEGEAKKIEEMHRDIRTREDIEAAIVRVKGDLESEPDSTRLLIQLGDLYKMARDWGQARAAYQQAEKLDPMNFLVQERLGDLKLAEMDEQMEELARDESNKERIAQLRKERMALALAEYQKRVRARPQDLPTRYSLGSILLELKRYHEASVQFQHAARDPKTRRPSLYRFGVCLVKQGLVGPAIEQFEKAVTGASVVDQETKEILYALASAHESQGHTAQALETYKKIFDVDINYKDVAAKTEELYRKGDQGAS